VRALPASAPERASLLLRHLSRRGVSDDLRLEAERSQVVAKVHAAVDDLISRKPHLTARRPTGKVGQGARPRPPRSVSRRWFAEGR
jgi:hypothetical protein